MTLPALLREMYHRADEQRACPDRCASFPVNLSGGAAVVYFLIVFGYYLVMESLTGQTVGKKLMGLRVAAVDGSLTWGKGALRTIVRIGEGLPAFYPGR